MLKHLCFVDVVVVDVLVAFDNVDVDAVDGRDVKEFGLDDVADVLDVVDVGVVVVPHPLQVPAQCVMLATRLSHKPCLAKAMH